MSSVANAAKAIAVLVFVGFASLAAIVGWCTYHERKMDAFCNSIPRGMTLAGVQQKAHLEGFSQGVQFADDDSRQVSFHGQPAPLFRTGCEIDMSDGKVESARRVIHD